MTLQTPDHTEQADATHPRPETPIVSFRGIAKAFAGVQALSAVNLDLFAGEVHAVLGENGAGKSTLMKILFGVVAPDAGEIVIADLGRTVIASPRHALSLGIGLVSQELSLAPQLEVAQNVFLGQARMLSLVHRRRLRDEAARILGPIAPNISVSAPVSSLNMAERQVVEIARTLARGGRVIAFDEPTSSLTPAERDGLFAVIGELRKSGKAIVYISHRMPEIAAIADRVTVLRDGRVVASGPIVGFTQARLSELIVGRKFDEAVARGRTVVGEVGVEALRLDSVSTSSIRGVSATLRKGEIFGLTGLVGSGRTEVARAIFGVDRLTAGAMSLNGRPYRPRDPSEAIGAGVALIPEDRRREALVPLMDVQRNFGLGNERFFSRFGFVRGRLRRTRAEQFIESLQIRPKRATARIRDLSGGNQQKVIIARWLQSGAKIFLVDEPTRGVDIGAKSEIHMVLRRLAEDGAAVLIISSEIPELLTLADRIGVMRDGALIHTLANAPDLTEEKLVAYSAAAPIQQRAAS